MERIVMHYGQNLNKQWIMLTLTILLVVPLVVAQENVTAQNQQNITAPDMIVSIPDYSKSAMLTLEGTTVPFTNVHAFVNGVRQRVFNVKADGVFKVVNLPLQAGENTIKLETRKNETILASKESKIIYDGVPPKVKLDKDLPDVTKEQTLKVTGDVNEKVTIKYRVIHRTDKVAPEFITGLKTSKIETEAVELSWEPSAATDLKEYIIKRNNAIIATTSITSFRDEGLLPETSYAYQVMAMDTSCNIGEPTPLTVITKSGNATGAVQPTARQNLTCEPPFETTTAGSPFSLNLALTEGINDVEIVFEDAAGNQETIEKTVFMDTTPPKFEDTNLEEISPSYAPDVKIKGKLDAPGTVFVYFNDEKKPSTFVVTEPDGSFSAKEKLRTTVRLKKGEKTAAIEVGEGWVNKVKLEAVDLAGNKATYGPIDVDYLLCGSGTWWQSNIGEPLPAVLLPRLMMQGVQQIGIPFTLNYIGTQNMKLGKIEVRPILLSPEAKKDYDHDWIQVNPPYLKTKAKNVTGYIQIRFDRVEPLPDKPGATPGEKEKALSDHRKGECLIPGAGCAKLFLQLEIQFQEIIPLRATDPRQPLVTPKIENRVQRICMPIQATIDKVIPADVIPKGLLRNAVKIIGKVITYIDKVLEPLTTVGEYVLYGCLFSNVVQYFMYFQERLTCDASRIFEIFGDGGWNKAVAEAGLCDVAYKDDAKKQGACKKCEKTMETRKKFETNIVHGLCDRIGCPSAPTFSTYIKDQTGEAESLDEISKQVQQNDPAYYAKWSAGIGKIYSGNDCAFNAYAGMDYISPTYSGIGEESSMATIQHTQQPMQTFEEIKEEIRKKEPSVGEGLSLPFRTPITGQVTHETKQNKPATTTPGKLGIRELFDIAKKKGAPKTISQGPTADDCKKLMRPAHPNCCGIAYQREWSSACGIGTQVSDNLDLFDELEQSTCLAAQKANIPTTDLKCNRLWNSIAGFCESKTGEPTAQTVNTESEWVDRKVGADENAVYIFMIPEGFRQGRFGNVTSGIFGLGGTAQQYKVYRGYAVKTPQFEKMPQKPKDRFVLNNAMTAVLETDLTKAFGQQAVPRAERGKVQKLDEKQQQATFYTLLCGDGKIKPCEKDGNAKRAYERVKEIIEVPEDEYIVRPSSGLFRSVQCACIPAVVSYLQLWRNVLGLFYNCFNKILLTGEGSAGWCAAKFSGTICDLFFEAISCIAQKFNTPGVGGRAGLGGFSDVLGALTGAGTDVSRSASQRYGETGLYNTLFNQRKFVNALCVWAFTGTWDLDVSAIFRQQVDAIPIDSTAMLSTCQRTFIAYDPTTQPAGLTTWAYRIGGALIAGADLEYRLKLKCSSGFGCDPRDYKDGKCDCQTQVRELPIYAPELGPGRAHKLDVIDFEVPYVVEAQSSPDSDIRYDTAILEWTWTDKQTKTIRTDHVDCSMRETEGGGAPLFCSFDVFSGKFRCMFGEQEAGIRITSIAATYPQNQDAFGLTQPLNFSLQIKQKFPPEERGRKLLQNKKFLTYDIRDAAGNTVLGKLGDDIAGPQPLKVDINKNELPSKYELSTDGTYTINIPMPAEDTTPLSTFIIDEDVINRHGVSAVAPALRQKVWGVGTTKSFVKTISLIDSAGMKYTGKRTFLVDFPKFSTDPDMFDIWLMDPAKDYDKFLSASADGWISDATLLVAEKKKQQEGAPTTRITFPLKESAVIGAKEYTTTLEFERVTGFPTANRIQIIVEYKPETLPATAAKPCQTKEPVPWTAIFTVYDADRNGVPTEQISTDPETGEAQQKFVTFNVRCASPGEIAKVLPKISVEEASWLTKLKTLTDLQVAMFSNWATKMAEIPLGIVDPAEVKKQTDGLRNQMDEIIKAVPAELQKLDDVKKQLKEDKNKHLADAAQQAINDLNTIVLAARTTLYAMNINNAYNVTEANKQVKAVKEIIDETKSKQATTSTNVQGTLTPITQLSQIQPVTALAEAGSCTAQGGTCLDSPDACVSKGGTLVYGPFNDCLSPRSCCKTTPEDSDINITDFATGLTYPGALSAVLDYKIESKNDLVNIAYCSSAGSCREEMVQPGTKKIDKSAIASVTSFGITKDGTYDIFIRVKSTKGIKESRKISTTFLGVEATPQTLIPVLDRQLNELIRIDKISSPTNTYCDDNNFFSRGAFKVDDSYFALCVHKDYIKTGKAPPYIQKTCNSNDFRMGELQDDNDDNFQLCVPQDLREKVFLAVLTTIGAEASEGNLPCRTGTTWSGQHLKKEETFVEKGIEEIKVPCKKNECHFETPSYFTIYEGQNAQLCVSIEKITISQ